MALFGSVQSFIGLDIGTSSLKVVELLNRRRRLELSTYAQADVGNLLLDQRGGTRENIAYMASVITRLLDAAGVSTDAVVAALPSSVVFSTVLTLPNMAEKDLEKAVHFAARDVVPANLDEMVLGWSRLGTVPHMDSDSEEAWGNGATQPEKISGNAIPIFVTAAPKEIVSRYTRLMELVKLDLFALEVETFPLVRSLLASQNECSMIVDIGDTITTFHVIDGGTPRVTYSLDVGGQTITRELARQLRVSEAEAEVQKMTYGLSTQAPPEVRAIIEDVVKKMITQATSIHTLYERQVKRAVTKTVLIGGGARLRDISTVWQTAVGHSVTVGNPWKGLSYPQELEGRLQELGTTYAVSVGLAQRGFARV